MAGLRRILFGGLLVVLVAIGGFYLWLRTSLPTTDGAVRVNGISGDVTIARDDHGIPRIKAATEEDAYFGLGFVHAQDRLWQMDFNRRLGSGRLAEVTGRRALPIDRIMRTLGVRRLAEKSFALLSPQARRAVEAYSAGINAYLDSHSGAWPIEFYLLRYRPEAWNPADSLLWGRLMAMRLGRNWHSEAARALLSARLPPERLNELWPAAGDLPKVASGLPSSSVLGDLGRRVQAAMTDALLPVQASNSWVVSGRHTISGKPLLAGDP
ncbi:MAG: penicillin acylase family protein, partial [Alphaproteobacteria bacterium]